MDGIWEQEYKLLMETARKHLDPGWEHGEAVVLKTAAGNLYVARIPDYQNACLREPLENQCVQRLKDADDTRVIACLATVNGKHPEILSWNIRSRLVEAESRNLQTVCFLWGGGENVHAKPFSALLPPKKTQIL